MRWFLLPTLTCCLLGCASPTNTGEVLWLRAQSGTSSNLLALSGSSVIGSSTNDVWAVGEFGAVVHFNGQSWSPMPIPGVATTLRAVQLTDWGRGFVAGDDGLLAELSDDGWQVRQTGSALDFTAMHVTPSGRVLLVSQTDTSLWDGTTLRPVMAGATPLQAIDVAGVGEEAWLLDRNQRVWKWAAGELTALPSPPRGNDWAFIAASGAESIVLSERFAALGMARLTGVTWSLIPTPGRQGQVTDLLAEPSSMVWASSDDGAVASWFGEALADQPSKAVAAPALRGVWASASSDLFAVGDSGWIQRRTAR